MGEEAWSAGAGARIMAGLTARAAGSAVGPAAGSVVGPAAASVVGPAAGPAPRPGYPQPSSAGRSANMRANRRADTKPELALRRALHRLGPRYRQDYRLALADGGRVRPDIPFTAREVRGFVDGCFWYCCPENG